MMLGCGKEMELKRGKEWAVCVWGILEGDFVCSRYCQQDPCDTVSPAF
jgi:hypothetical protein